MTTRMMFHFPNVIPIVPNSEVALSVTIHTRHTHTYTHKHTIKIIFLPARHGGPFACGHKPDISIFQQGLIHKLFETGELVEADCGYGGEPGHIRIPANYGTAHLGRRAPD